MLNPLQRCWHLYEIPGMQLQYFCMPWIVRQYNKLADYEVVKYVGWLGGGCSSIAVPITKFSITYTTRRTVGSTVLRRYIIVYTEVGYENIGYTACKYEIHFIFALLNQAHINLCYLQLLTFSYGAYLASSNTIPDSDGSEVSNGPMDKLIMEVITRARPYMEKNML